MTFANLIGRDDVEGAQPVKPAHEPQLPMEKIIRVTNSVVSPGVAGPSPANAVLVLLPGHKLQGTLDVAENQIMVGT